MKPVFVRVVLFDPVTDEEFEVFDGVEVEVAEVLAYNPTVGFDVLRLAPDPRRGIYSADAPRYDPGKSHFFRVGFRNANFSKVANRLLPPAEVTPALLPIFSPSRVPYWDSGWDDDYETNEFFGYGDATFDSTARSPLRLRIPLRAMYNIGHRGAPHYYPENTLASFRQALNLGANALEFDLCLTKNRRIAVFHDPEPVMYPTRLDRTAFENLPYEFVSPEFTYDGRYAIIKELRNGRYETVEKKRMTTEHDLDIIRLTLGQVRKYYRYHHVNGVEHGIPELEEVLTLAREEPTRLQLLFLDVKNPDWDEEDDRARFVKYGELLGKKLQQFPDLRQKMVVTNVSEEVLRCLKEGIANAGETRPEYAYDAQGGFGAIFGFKKNPLTVARQMDNSVVSIGSLFRPGNLDEISEATRDRDYNAKSEISTVIHWTLNEPSQMYLSLAAGVSGIVTDKPDELKKILARLRMTLQPSAGHIIVA